MRVLAWLLFGLVLIGCSSGPDAKEPFDEELASTTTDGKEKVGLKDDKVYIKKKVYLEERLFQLKDDNEDMERAIYGRSKRDPGGMWEGLRDCRKRLADPRVGGKGIPAPMEPWRKITETEEAYEFMVDKDKHIVGVSEEELGDRLERMKKHRRMLSDSYDRFKEKLEVCEAKYRTALVQYGMNPEDTKVKGEWVEGPNGYKVWRMKRSSTDDPEELMRRKAKRENSN